MRLRNVATTTNRCQVQIFSDDFIGPRIHALLGKHFTGMLANSPEGSCHFLDLGALNATDVTFWSIWHGEALAGCGAVKKLSPTHGEIKSTRTDAAPCSMPIV